MSQSTLPEQLPPPNSEGDEVAKSNSASLPSDAQSAYDLDYTPMPVMAPVSLFLGISAFAALMGLFGMVLALVGILVSIGSYLQIRAAKGRLSGANLAIAGGLLSAGFLGLGSYLMISDYKAELPPGYQRVNFPSEIAEKGFVAVQGRREIHPDVKPLVEKPLFLKGYIWQSADVKSGFILLKDDGKCCFGGSPAPNDMIKIRLEPNTHFQYISGLVSVAGVLHADPNAPEGQAVYVMDAKMVTKAKTVF